MLALATAVASPVSALRTLTEIAVLTGWFVSEGSALAVQSRLMVLLPWGKAPSNDWSKFCSQCQEWPVNCTGVSSRGWDADATARPSAPRPGSARAVSRTRGSACGWSTRAESGASRRAKTQGPLTRLKIWTRDLELRKGDKVRIYFADPTTSR